MYGPDAGVLECNDDGGTIGRSPPWRLGQKACEALLSDISTNCAATVEQLTACSVWEYSCASVNATLSPDCAAIDACPAMNNGDGSSSSMSPHLVDGSPQD
jgi:hypothetical protein